MNQEIAETQQTGYNTLTKLVFRISIPRKKNITAPFLDLGMYLYSRKTVYIQTCQTRRSLYVLKVFHEFTVVFLIVIAEFSMKNRVK